MMHISEILSEMLESPVNPLSASDQPMRGQGELFFCDEVNSEFVVEVPC